MSLRMAKRDGGRTSKFRLGFEGNFAGNFRCDAGYMLVTKRSSPFYHCSTTALSGRTFLSRVPSRPLTCKSTRLPELSSRSTRKEAVRSNRVSKLAG